MFSFIPRRNKSSAFEMSENAIMIFVLFIYFYIHFCCNIAMLHYYGCILCMKPKKVSWKSKTMLEFLLFREFRNAEKCRHRKTNKKLGCRSSLLLDATLREKSRYSTYFFFAFFFFRLHVYLLKLIIQHL